MLSKVRHTRFRLLSCVLLICMMLVACGRPAIPQSGGSLGGAAMPENGDSFRVEQSSLDERSQASVGEERAAVTAESEGADDGHTEEQAVTADEDEQSAQRAGSSGSAASSVNQAERAEGAEASIDAQAAQAQGRAGRAGANAEQTEPKAGQLESKTGQTEPKARQSEAIAGQLEQAESQASIPEQSLRADQTAAPASQASPSNTSAEHASEQLAWDEDDNTLTFKELYASVGVRGIELSDKVNALTGKEVEMSGYMAPPLTAGVKFFVLTKALMAVCPFCSTDADWPTDIVVVYLPDGEELKPTEHPVKVTGTLDTGSFTDEDTGFVSLVRIYADKVEVMK